MFAHESWMNIFFRLFNFVALMALLTFLFRRYILQSIRDSIIQDKQHEEGMEIQVVILENKGKELAQTTIQQEHETRFLINKAEQWQATYALEQEKKRHEQKVLCDAVQLKKQQQLKAIESQELLEIVIPQAIQQARVKLMATFAGEEQGRHYVRAVLDAMKKSL